MHIGVCVNIVPLQVLKNPMKNLIRHVPITRTLLFVYVLLFLVLGAIRYVEYQNITKATDTLHHLTTSSADREGFLNQLLNNNNAIRVSELLFLYSKDTSQVQEAAARVKNLVQANRGLRSAYQNLIADSIEQQYFDRTLAALKHIHKTRKDIFGLAEQNLASQARDIDSREMQHAYEHFRGENMQLAQYVLERDQHEAEVLKFNLSKAVKLTRVLTFIIGFLLTVLGIIIIAAIRVLISKKNQLTEIEHRQRLFIEQTNEFIISLDPAGHVRFGNKKVKAFFNCTDSELQQLHLFSLLTKKYAAAARQAFRHPEKNKVMHISRCCIENSDGKKLFVEGNLTWDFAGDVFLGATCFLNDITETVRLQRSLKNSEHKFRELFNMAPISMYTFDPDSLHFLQVNAAAIEQYGYSEKEFLEKTIYDIRPRDEFVRTAHAIDLIIEQKQSYNAYYKHVTRDGSIKDVEIFASRIMIKNRPVVMATIVDITSRKLHENRITQAIIKTQEEERYEIGAELHDNVCQLLASARMSLGMIKKQLPAQSEPYYSQSVASITLAAEEIRNLSHRLAPVFFKNSTLKDSFSRLLNTFNVSNDFAINMYFDEAVEALSLSRELQLNLYRILQEQLRNIMKYAHATEVRLDVLLHSGRLHMLIGDNGVGFDPETTPGGIGLANMKRRVEFFSGKMTLFTAPGDGCEIMVVVPVCGEQTKDAG